MRRGFRRHPPLDLVTGAVEYFGIGPLDISMVMAGRLKWRSSMAQGPYTRIIVQRPDGKVEVVGRPGMHDPHAVSRLFSEAGSGKVIAVRHESMPAGGGVHQTLAIHEVK